MLALSSRHRLGAAALATLTLALAGCPDDDAPRPAADAAADAADAAADSAPDPTDATPPTPEAALAAATAALCPGYAERYCAETARCGCTAAPGYPADCRASFEAACATQLASYLEVVRRGEAVYEPAAATTCFAALPPVYDACLLLPQDMFFFLCPILAPPGGFTDLPGLGAPCEGSCALPLRCSTEGRCVTPGAADAPCASPYDCDPTLVCADERCQPPRHAAVGTSCAGPNDCPGDTACLASARKVCRAPLAAGPCRWDDDCPAHSFCAPDASGGDEGTCTPGGASGEPCGSGTVCAAGLACAPDTSLCGPIPQAGDPCALSAMGPVLCADGLACVDGLCASPPAEGQTCAMGVPHCAPGLGCAFEGADNVCRPRRTAGGECQNDETCADGHFCNFRDNRCEANRAVGALCSDGNECGPDGACLPDPVFTFRCAPRPGDGETCFLADCDPGLICRTPYTAGVCAPVLCEALRF